jgi:hypothetical protein
MIRGIGAGWSCSYIDRATDGITAIRTAREGNIWLPSLPSIA